MINWTNGNASIHLESDGTRTIEFPDGMPLILNYPLNIDIRVSDKCAFGMNPETGKAICSFCHESAKTNGVECDYEKLKEKLEPLPYGIELAIGANELTDGLVGFIHWCYGRFVVNLTLNQGHIFRDLVEVKYLLYTKLIQGLGISYRKGMKPIPKEIAEHNNVVAHVIAGIDSFDEVLDLKNQGFKKILVLGEKDFGFNYGKVNLNTACHNDWYRNINKMFKQFEVVSFDNLGIEQLYIKRFFAEDEWKELFQGEHSMYINAVTGKYHINSRSVAPVWSWDRISIQDFFLRFVEENV